MWTARWIADSVLANRFAFLVYEFDVRGRTTEGRSMDRDFGKPKTSQMSTGISAGLGRVCQPVCR
jgi:hypothetical protein